MKSSSPNTIAIIGASQDRHKFGNKAVRAYHRIGWTVYPVHLSATEIEGLKAYHSIRDVPLPIERVSVYLPPTIGVTLLDDVASVSPMEFFLNPGSESPELIDRARALGLNVIVACSIVDVGLNPSEFTEKT